MFFKNLSLLRQAIDSGVAQGSVALYFADGHLCCSKGLETLEPSLVSFGVATMSVPAPLNCLN
jgi:hypothetical protein